MRTRSIAGQPVPAVGLGDVSLARASARGRDPAEVVRRVHDAIEAAIDVIDVADDAEAAVGEVVRALRARDRVMVATRIATAGERGGVAERLPPRYVQERVESSLRATKLDAIPLAQLPVRAAWCTSSAWPELRGTCDRLVREGKVLRWGAIGDEPAIVEEGWFATIAIELSLCRRAAVAMIAAAAAPPRPRETAAPPSPPALALSGDAVDPKLLAAALAQPELTAHLLGVADVPLIGAAPKPAPSPAPKPASPPPPHVPAIVLARQPLAGGALAGTLGPGVRLAPRDDRRALTDKELETIAIGVARLAPFVKHEPPAARSCEAARTVLEATPRPPHVECATLAELALRYVIDRGALALPRIHTNDDLQTLRLAAAAPPLSPELIARIDELWPDPTS